MGAHVKFAFECGERPPPAGRRVAVVGAGPAGLWAAGHLACHGYEVDVYDKQPLPGGLMVFAIPPWRLPKERVLGGARELEEKFGVKFVLRTKVFSGEQRREEGDGFAERSVPLEDLVSSYDAVLVATGTWSSKVPQIPGADAAGVTTALEYLYEHRVRELGLAPASPPRAKKAVVVGGGYSAIDAAEQALRDGSEVMLAYRRTIKEAPAGVFEIERVRREGVEVAELVSPAEVVAEGGRAVGVKFQRMRLGEPDETGRPRPVPIPGSEFFVEADLVIFATGEAPTPPATHDAAAKLGVKLERDGRVVVNKIYQSGNPKVFAAGDVVSGPSRIGPAMRSGLYAAKFLISWLEASLIKPAPTAR